MASLTPEERRKHIQYLVSAKRRKRMSKAERIRKARVAKKNRIKRKYRSRLFRSRKGMKARGAGGKIIRKRFFIVTYDATGRPKGTLWFSAPKPSQQAKDEHLEKYKVKHPLLLPVINEKKLAGLKKARTSSRSAKNKKRRGRS